MINLNKKVYTDRSIYVYGKYYFELELVVDKRILSYNKIVRCSSSLDYFVLELKTKHKTYNGNMDIDVIEQDIIKIVDEEE